ncbi:contractile injection system tape measure protein [Pseudoalteromonas byunsanensis]|uniref:Uncharacterized protein n=1 Tax=Pseudoalteromonas byunsanensis TaxID=327939 RepID=A0A1S1MXA3_9GAMM|nr:contractile injection system tape measure protein [Pseudoalteromonas byunsanensis]OHU93542.1 hypothetical protein BIW53_19555 [Pseudoalteromonas byunsanensis]
MMMSKHMIGQCQWQTSFDDQSNVTQLQDALSQWSNQILPSVLNSVFERYCPSGQTWRIEQLHIDLGSLTLNELDTQLSQKVAAAVEQALLNMLQQYGTESKGGKGNKLTIVAQGESELALLRWFLLYGVTPWWVVGNNSPLHVVDSQMSQQPNAVASVLRDVGHLDAVRRRIVWQWGEARTRKTVQVLEPWNAQFICSYADNVILAQRQSQSLIPKDSHLQTHLWYWILTHLLVDRGTLFNTSQFVKATLWQMAQHYQISFYDLLAQLSCVAKNMQETGLVAPQFLQVLVDIQHSEQRQQTAPSKVDDEANLWSLFSKLLHAKQTSTQHQSHTYYLTELFIRLAQVGPSKMAQVLKHEGQTEAVRLHIVKQFDEQQLAHIVEVVAPHDTQFILAHVSHTQALLREQHLDPALIWRVLLAYLFVNRGSYFNRRQFVHTTLTGVSQHFGVDYHLILLMLQQTSSMPSKAGQQYELFTILADLQQQQAKQAQHNDALWLRHYQALIDVQTQQSSVQHSALLGQFASLSWQQAVRGMVMVRPLASPRSLFTLLKRSNLGVSQRYLLAQKLVAAMASSSVVALHDIKHLLSALSPNHATQSMQLITALLDWQKQGLMPWSAHNGSLIALLESVVFSLMNQTQVHSLEQWFIQTTHDIAQRFAVSQNALLQQMCSNVQQHSLSHQPLDNILIQCLKGALNTQFTDLATVSTGNSNVPEHVIYSPLSYSQIKALKALAIRFKLPVAMVLKLCADFVCKGGLQLEVTSAANTFEFKESQFVSELTHYLATHFALPVRQLYRYLAIQLARATSLSGSLQQLQYFSAEEPVIGVAVGQSSSLARSALSLKALQQVLVKAEQDTLKRQIWASSAKQIAPIGVMTMTREHSTPLLVKSVTLPKKAPQSLAQAIRYSHRQPSQPMSELFACLLAMRGTNGAFTHGLHMVRDHKSLLDWLLNPFDMATKMRWLYRLYLASASANSAKGLAIDEAMKPVSAVKHDELIETLIQRLRQQESKLALMMVQKAAAMNITSGHFDGLFKSSLVRRWLAPLLPAMWQDIGACDRWCHQLQTWLCHAIEEADNRNGLSPVGQFLARKHDIQHIKQLFWQLMAQHFDAALNTSTSSLKAATISIEQVEQLVAALILRWSQAHALNLTQGVAQFERYSIAHEHQFMQPKSSLERVLSILKRVTHQGSFKAIAQNLSAQESPSEQRVKRIAQQRVNSPKQENHAKTEHLERDQTATSHPDVDHFERGSAGKWIQDLSGVYLNRTDIKAVMSHWLQHGSRPHFIAQQGTFSGARLLDDMQLHKPKQWCDIVQPLLGNEIVLARIANHTTLTMLLDTLNRADKLSQSHSNMFNDVLRLLNTFNRLGLALSPQECEQYMLLCLLTSLAKDELVELSAESLLQSVCWLLVQRQACSAAELLTILNHDELPNFTHVMNALSELRKQLTRYRHSTRRQADNSSLQHETLDRILREEACEAPEQPTEFPMSVPNAGLVLIQSFIPHLFDRLGLVSDDKFISEEKQRAAVHYLQFLVTGQSTTEEHHLVLNKLLCGHGVTHPVEAGITLPQSEIDTIHSLIEAVCNYWPAIGKTSVDGFRGNWLVRSGTLTEAPDHWDLIVEKRVYDILISRSPLSYSIVKLPWMEKPIYVTWPT